MSSKPVFQEIGDLNGTIDTSKNRVKFRGVLRGPNVKFILVDTANRIDFFRRFLFIFWHPTAHLGLRLQQPIYVYYDIFCLKFYYSHQRDPHHWFCLPNDHRI